ncbi:hypothetical protein LTR97_004749 [Elasticomyces elasticus]|uniref:Uncharacterized protein n=1 Tax=Elasticomyces elasticus TaxID=574655 RepID=A0AAN7W785_9PEZI|nr:hypothetical protein LTR97_004749 [Elasticomyces elasticus]
MADQIPYRPNPNNMQLATPTDQDRIQALTEELAGKDKIIEDLKAMKQAYGEIIGILQHAVQHRDVVQALLESHVGILEASTQKQGEHNDLLRKIVRGQQERIEEADGVIEMQGEEIATLEERDRVLKGIEAAFGKVDLSG